VADGGRPELAVYYFPNFHRDPRTELLHGPGWTEWELVRRATPRFAGHRQPKTPLWGYEDEADPAVFARKLDVAADHGVDVFLFDWYWYDGPFLNRALDEGYLGAGNTDRVRFALMWANHDWVDIFPAKANQPPRLLFPGAVDRATFDRVTEHVVEHYFTHPAYWTLAGRPYFSVYELSRLIDGLGGIVQTADALDAFRQRCRRAGLPGLHLNAVVWGIRLLPGETSVANPATLVGDLGFDSVTSYVWIHHVPLPTFPSSDYAEVADAAACHWEQAAREFPVPYHPNVTVGWDSSPRTERGTVFRNVGYPFMPILEGNSPQAFRTALARARDFAAANGRRPAVVTVNAWNEWTEGSYLEPDTNHGMAYLEAIRSVFED
jgi:hypothetical protein